ncbi:MAG: GlxA family transcriptional regulator, partial [Chloroflexota bacterium]
MPLEDDCSTMLSNDRSLSCEPKRIVFYLDQEFNFIDFSLAVDVLRLANTAVGYRAYDWSLVSLDGSFVRATCGVDISVDCDLATERKKLFTSARPAMVIVSGVFPSECKPSSTLSAWLRECTLCNVLVAAVGSASFVLAHAGLLERKKCAIHWENLPSFAEKFTKTFPNHTIFQEDSGVWTCPGGMVVFHMMLQILAGELGGEVLSSVCDQVLVQRARLPGERQRIPLVTYAGVVNENVIAIVEHMELNLFEPLSLEDLASRVRLSRRQVERLFRRHIGCSPVRYYRELRLERAKLLLAQTQIPIVEIAISCGFASASHFSKCYRDEYGLSPVQARRSEYAQAVGG